MEPAALALPLAKEAAKLLLRVWLNRPLGGNVSPGLNELVDAASSDVFERRRLRRQFEQVADRIAAQLAPFLESEFAGIPENEVAAAARLAEEVLAGTEISPETLAAVDANPRAVEADARRSSVELIDRAYLSDSGQAIFDLLLKETTDYVVDLAVGLPPFNSAAAQEMLRRETLIIARIDEVLQRLPQTPKFLSGPASGASEAFEIEFRRAVSRKFDQLELFGLDLEDYRSYTLSIAYITLSVERSPRPSSTEQCAADEDGGREAGFRSGSSDQAGYVTAIQALSEMPRALLTGEAGSGKTTLLRWLAVQACRGELERELPSWGNPIPFFIPLRRSVGVPLPQPERFVQASAPQLAGVMPPGWVHDQLSSGRGLVLVDGVDELPPRQRDDVRRWLDDLVTTFPDSRFVVTSRPPAVEEGWLEPLEFGGAELQPMSYTDIASFIQHWHEASLTGTEDAEERERVAELARRLQELIRTDGAVRSLATSPLLCAMLCALHRDRKAQLPRGRLEVYRVALESLVERRDAEREVAHGLPAQSLSLPEKMVLLKDLSYWLLVNGYSDAPRDRCVERVESKLASMPHLDYSGAEVFDYLLTRSGVLREPASGRIDFLHRTFQEYLAAGEIVEQDNVGQLVQLAHSDEWSVVTVLAAGQGRRQQREDLIRGLIERGRSEPGVSHRLHLLAVSCLDTSVELSPKLSAELELILGELIPPRTLTEANALASAGELAVPLLAARWQDRDARTTAACVRSLGLIGGELAVTTLAALAADYRVTVAREIIRMWDEFDPDEYARRVLENSPMFIGRQVWLPTERAHLAVHLKGLKGLQAGYRAFEWGRPDNRIALEPLTECPDLERLKVSGVGGVDVDPLPAFGKLTSFALERCGGIENLDRIGQADQLESLAIERTPVESLEFLSNLEELEQLWLERIGDGADLSPLGALGDLRSLTLNGIEDARGSDFFEGLDLEDLVLGDTNLARADLIVTQERLVSLSVRSAAVATAELSSLPLLEDLKIEAADLVRLEIAADCNLRQLSLTGAKPLRDIGGIRHCSKLTHLALEGAVNLNDIDPIGTCTSLVGLALVYTAVSDLSPLRGMEKLERVSFWGTSVTDFSPLADLPNLRVVGVDETVVREARRQLPNARVVARPLYIGRPIRLRRPQFFISPSAL